MKFIFALCSVVAICAAEAPRSGPYPASGWKPKGTQFLLPGQFLPQTNRAQDETTNVEINKEQVNFVGQVTETEQRVAEPNQAYLPPAADSDYPEENVEENTDGLKVQGLPQEIPSDENTAQFSEPQNENEISQQYRFQNNQRFNGRIQQQTQQRNLNYFNRQPQFGRLVQGSNIQRYQQPRRLQFARQQVAPPSQEYGAPRDNADNNEEVEENAPITSADEQPTSSIANNVQSGRYYVLTPDNTLQRVNFQTFQDEEETRTNGFTAQLKYMPVEPIRDPIYAYNEQGVLVRIYRK